MKRSKEKRALSYPDIIERLKNIMEHGPLGAVSWKKWTQAKLARALNKDHAMISRWMNPGAGNEMTITSLLSICEAMKIDPSLLFRD